MATTPPTLLTIPAFLEQQGSAVRTNVMAMGEGSIMAMFDDQRVRSDSARGPGVDPFPWRDSCRLGAQCHLSWPHTTTGP